MSDTTPKATPYRRGNYAFWALLFITIIEFVIPIYYDSAVIIILLGIAKAGIIMQIFMNIARLWSEEDHH